MFKLLIADDEAGSREWLAQEIRWEDHDICLVGPAGDGAEAWRLFEAENPEIILTDIRMPGLNGIDLARAVFARNPRTRILVISGYDEFAYAKACLEIGVSGYILKPTPPQEILQAVLKERDIILARQADEAIWASIQSQLRESIPLLREQFLRDLWRGEVERETIAERLRFLQIPLSPGQPAVVMVLEVKDRIEFYRNHDEKERQLIWLAIDNLTRAALSEAGCAVRLERGVVGALVYSAPGTTVETLLEQADRIARALLDQARSNLPCALAIGIGGAEDITVSYRSFAQAKQALLMQTKFSVESLAAHAGCYSQARQLPFLSMADEERLGVSLATGAADETVHAVIQYLLASASETDPEASEWRRETGWVLSGALIRIAQRNGLTLREIIPAEDYALLLQGGPAGETAPSWWETACGLLGHAIGKLQKDSLRACIRKAKEYIEANLCGTIGLAEAAREVYLSPSYLSRLFREQTGENFSEYVTRRRMEEARRLLDTGEKKVYEVSAAVGYADPAYFGRVFRQYFNITPTEYRAGNREVGT